MGYRIKQKEKAESQSRWKKRWDNSLSQACCGREACLGPSGCWARRVGETAGDRAWSHSSTYHRGWREGSQSSRAPGNCCLAQKKKIKTSQHMCTLLTVIASQWLPVCVLPWLPYSLLLPPVWDSKGYGEGPGPSWAIISITLGMIIWLGLIVLNLLASGPSGSSLMWMSDFIATGRQLHVGSMVTSSNSELLE